MNNRSNKYCCCGCLFFILVLFTLYCTLFFICFRTAYTCDHDEETQKSLSEFLSKKLGDYNDIVFPTNYYYSNPNYKDEYSITERKTPYMGPSKEPYHIVYKKMDYVLTYENKIRGIDDRGQFYAEGKYRDYTEKCNGVLKCRICGTKISKDVAHDKSLCFKNGINKKKRKAFYVGGIGNNICTEVDIYVKEKIYFTEAELKEIQKIWDNLKNPYFFTYLKINMIYGVAYGSLKEKYDTLYFY